MTLYGEYWPVTLPGKLLMLGMGIYSFSMLGYITAAIGSFFIGLDHTTEHRKAPPAIPTDIESLRRDIQELTRVVAALKAAQEPTA